MREAIFRMERVPGNEGAWFLPHEVLYERDDPCGTCGRIPSRFVRPFAFEYQSGQPVDLTWGSDTRSWLAKLPVAEALLERYHDFQEYPAYVLKSGFAGPYEGVTPRRVRKYPGPELVELVLRTNLVVPLTNPGFDDIEICRECGLVNYKLRDTELPPHEVKIGDEWVMQPPRPRERGKGLILTREEVGDARWFSVHRLFTYCLAEARDFVVQSGFTGVRFLEVGEVVD